MASAIVKKKGTYYEIAVDAKVENYCWPRCGDKYDPDSVSDLVRMKFGFVVGYGGYHTALFSNEGIYEVHQDNEGNPSGPDKLYEKSPFNMWKPGEGNRVGGAGIIMVPPGTQLPD